MSTDLNKKLCSMIDHTYQIITSLFNSEGVLLFISTELTDESIMASYLKQASKLMQHSVNRYDIQISVDEIALSWISIPVNTYDKINGYIIIGPFFSSRVSETSIIEVIGKMDISEEEKLLLINYYSIIAFYPYKEYIRLIKFVHFQLYEQEFDESKLGLISDQIPENLSIGYNVGAADVGEAELHGTYLYERHMLECIRTGSLLNLKQLLNAGAKGREGAMIIGNEVRQAKDLFIVTTTLATRAAIEGGLNCESALSLSDFYIRQVESMKSTNDIMEYIPRMLLDFTRRVHELLKINAFSYYVNRASEYIQMHIYKSISVAEVARQLKISQEHLSRLFKNETGMAVNEYIKKVKIREAKFLLKYTDYTLVEISQKLAYSSQSHFNTAFKSETSFTPKQFRDQATCSSTSPDN